MQQQHGHFTDASGLEKAYDSWCLTACEQKWKEETIAVIVAKGEHGHLVIGMTHAELTDFVSGRLKLLQDSLSKEKRELVAAARREGRLRSCKRHLRKLERKLEQA